MALKREWALCEEYSERRIECSKKIIQLLGLRSFVLKHMSVIDMCFAPCSGRRVSFDGDCDRIGVKWIMAYEFYGFDMNKESAAFGFMTANRMTLFRCSTWTWCFMSMVCRFFGVSLYFQKSSTCRNYRYSNLAPLRKFWVLLRRSQWPRLRETKLISVEGAARYFLAVAKEETWHLR